MFSLKMLSVKQTSQWDRRNFYTNGVLGRFRCIIMIVLRRVYLFMTQIVNMITFYCYLLYIRQCQQHLIHYKEHQIYCTAHLCEIPAMEKIHHYHIVEIETRFCSKTWIGSNEKKNGCQILIQKIIVSNIKYFKISEKKRIRKSPNSKLYPKS